MEDVRLERMALLVQQSKLADEAAVIARLRDALMARLEETERKAKLSSAQSHSVLEKVTFTAEQVELLKEEAESVKRSADLQQELISPASRTTKMQTRLRSKLAERERAAEQQPVEPASGRDASQREPRVDVDTSPNNRTKRKKKKEPLAPQQNKASDPLATVSPHCESHVSLMHAQEEHEPDGMPEPGATTISPPPTPLLAHEEDAPDSMPEALSLIHI